MVRFVDTGNANVFNAVTLNYLTFDEIYGLDGDDLIFGAFGGRMIIEGGTGDDAISVRNQGSIFSYNLLYGGEGNDTFFLADESGGDQAYGGRGDDVFFGTDLSSEWMYGDDGNDTINGGGGSDHLEGGQGEDQLFGGAGDDYLIDGSGDNKLDAGADDDHVTSGWGNDTINAGSGNDWVTDSGGTNFIYGFAGVDRLIGGANVDTIFGGEGNDVILGGGGDDFLRGDVGQDLLWGSGGKDTFRYAAITDSTAVATSRDTIYDFIETTGANQDKIDVLLIDARASIAGNQAFVLDTNGVLTEGEIRARIVAGNTLVEGNVDADSTVEFAVVLAGVHTLSAANFIL